MALAKKPVGKPTSAPAKVTSTAAKQTQQPAPKANPTPAAAPQPKQQPAPPEETKAIATRPVETTALAQHNINLAADAEEYTQEYDSQDLATPFLVILQAKTPVAEKGNPEYIDGAEASMLFNTASKELWDGNEGLVFVPSYYNRTFIEWGIRENGGGFKADHGLARGQELLAATHKDDRNRDILPNGNQLVATAQHFGVVVSESGPQPVLLSMTSTQLKKSRNWNTRTATLTIDTPKGKKRAPLFSHSYRMTTVFEKNDKGSWYGWVIEPNGPTIETLGAEYYIAARQFADLVRAGSVVVKHEAEQVAGGGDTSFNPNSSDDPGF